MNNALTIPDQENELHKLGRMLGNNFSHNDERWVLDRTDPPSIEDSYAITGKIIGLQDTADQIQDQACWLLGNIIMECEDYFGDEFDVSVVCEVTGKSYNTCATSKSVFLEFGDRRVDELSFSHHKEVHYQKGLTTGQKSLILKTAAEIGMTCKQTRQLASYIKHEGDDILHMDYTPLEILNILDNYKKETKATYICITYDNVVSKLKEEELNDENQGHYQIIIQTTPELEIFKNAQQERTE